jgi:hypothetical protein
VIVSIIALGGAGAGAAIVSGGSSSSSSPGTTPSQITTQNIPSGTFSTRLGRSLTLTNGVDPAKVELSRIVDPATSDNSFLKSGERYLAAEIKFSDISAHPLVLWGVENATTVIGSDGQTYAADELYTVSECTSFHNGPSGIVSGQSITECAVFRVPAGVSVREVQIIDGDERGIWSNS